MAASVLGKRSRRALETEETASVAQQPPRKRATRSSTAQIFEEADVAQNAVLGDAAAPKSTSIRAQRTRKPAVKTRLQGKLETVKDVELLDAPEVAAEQDENCLPAELAFSTPSTTRFKDVFASTPSTPKHRVRAHGGLATPKTPRTIDASKPRFHNIYAQARQLFTQSAAPAKLIGRDTERQQIRSIVENAKSSGCGSCTYISGPPGTGKSALVQEVLQEHSRDTQIKISTINCVALKSAIQVYGKLMDDLLPTSTNSKPSAEAQLRKTFTSRSSKTTYVVMLDEVDSLVDTECEILYNIFEWSLHQSSSLTLIGIANALDLTDRFLPRLKARGLKPELLPFLPYTAPQIAKIISDKLRTLLPEHHTASADFVPFLHPAAIQLCGKKIASQTGDLRKAFNLVRKAIDQIEKEILAKQGYSSPIKQPLGEVTNSVLASARTPSKSQLSFNAETAPRATIAHMAKLTSSIFNNGTLSRLGGLNLQQKAVLCAVVNKETRRQERNPFVTPTKTVNKAPTVGELFTKYTSLCKRDDGLLQPLKDTEFRDVVASLETLGLVHEKARSSSLLTPSSSSRRMSDERQIVSAVAEKEMRDSLTGSGADLLRRLLDEI